MTWFWFYIHWVFFIIWGNCEINKISTHFFPNSLEHNKGLVSIAPAHRVFIDHCWHSQVEESSLEVEGGLWSHLVYRYFLNILISLDFSWNLFFHILKVHSQYLLTIKHNISIVARTPKTCLFSMLFCFT